MARSKLKIPRGLYLTWRARADGTIVFRWGMAPGLRRAGVKAIDLVDHNGTPLGKAAAITRAGELTRAFKEGRAPEAATPARPARTVGDLLDAYLAPASLDALRNAKTGEPLSQATKNTYRKWRVALDQVFADQPVNDVDHDLVRDWFFACREARGHHMAQGGLSLLRLALNWAPKEWSVADVEWRKVKAPRAPAKLRVGHPDELACLLRAMDDPASIYAELQARGVNDLPPIDRRIPPRPELGDSLVAAVWTTQRASNVLAFTEDACAGGRLRWRTSKNHRWVDMPLLGPLPARIVLAKQRKQARGLTTPHLIVDPDHDAAYDQERHGRHFREARALAARLYPSLAGEGLDPWGRMALRFTFEDCRDTGITRLHDSGCELLEICSWSNHTSVASLLQVINAYIEISGQTADRAGEKMSALWERNKHRWAV